MLLLKKVSIEGALSIIGTKGSIKFSGYVKVLQIWLTHNRQTRDHNILKKVSSEGALRIIGTKGSIKSSGNVKVLQIWVTHNRQTRDHNILKKVPFSRRPLRNLKIGHRGSLEECSKYL